MSPSVDRRRSLEELEGDRWGAPPAGSTGLVSTVHRLRRVPVGELLVEDLPVLIGQPVSLDALVPLALERLRDDPLTAGDMYPGDLLAAVLRADAGLWQRRPALAVQLRSILGASAEPPDGLAADVARFQRLSDPTSTVRP